MKTYERYSLKGAKSMPGRDGIAFHATLLLDGKKVAVVGNSGTGGPNDYHYDDGAQWRSPTHAALVEAAKEWARDNGQDANYSEIEDLFVESLLERLELRKIAARNGKKGRPATLFEWVGHDLYQTPLRQASDADLVLAKRAPKPDRHLVLEAGQ